MIREQERNGMDGMTNFEKAKEMWTIDMVTTGRSVALCNAIRKLRNEESCGAISCKQCIEWLKQEYKEPILDDVEKFVSSNKAI